jgi:hypothetical protein
MLLCCVAPDPHTVAASKKKRPRDKLSGRMRKLKGPMLMSGINRPLRRCFQALVAESSPGGKCAPDGDHVNRDWSLGAHKEMPPAPTR